MAARVLEDGLVALYVAWDIDGPRLSLLRFDAARRQVGPAVSLVQYSIDPGPWSIRGVDLVGWRGGLAGSWLLEPVARHGTARRSQGFVAFVDDSGRVVGFISLGAVNGTPLLSLTSGGVEVLYDDARRPSRRNVARLTCDLLPFPRSPARK